MAVGDLWLNKINCSTHNRAWSFGLWMREVTPISPTDDGGVASRAVHAHLSNDLTRCLSTFSNFDSVQSWRRLPGPARAGYTFTQFPGGSQVGDSLPNDSALYINLEQTFTDAKHNGGLYIAGQTDTNHSGNDWVPAYLDDEVAGFTNTLSEFVNAVGGDTGQFNFVILSKTFIPPTTSLGTPIDITSATATNRVMSQRRRQQKKRGLSPSGS